MAVQAIDSGLRESAVLTVVFHPDTRLESQSFRQGRRRGGGENPAVYDIDKRWSLFSGGMIPGGADHHPVKRQILPLKAEIGLVRLTGLELKSDRSVFIAN